MKILLLEDNGSVAYPLIESLEENGHEVFLATNIIGAGGYLESKKPDCLIVDLNMEPKGLTEEDVKQTQGGLFTGWIWLKNYVFAKDKSARERTIILTAYYDNFKKEFSEEIGQVKIISKEFGEGGGYESILSNVNAIAKRTGTKISDRER
jgi:CheY-like chemotaxis protein